MPPALVPLALVAIGVPAAMRAALGRPRSLGAAWVLAFAAVALAQAAGEIFGSRMGVLGDAQLLLASAAAALAAGAVSVAEPRRAR
ncbi:MAG TPA: hypothetical protein VGQ86_10850 [Candidatus Limnocylindria bacterium]|jgi:hypothetical protein|nr:hypothetical protein [Candidatus Limnocylindria bacterium]